MGTGGGGRAGAWPWRRRSSGEEAGVEPLSPLRPPFATHLAQHVQHTLVVVRNNQIAQLGCTHGGVVVACLQELRRARVWGGGG